METVQIKEANNGIYAKIVKIVEEIIAAKQSNFSSETLSLENEIDQVVYQLYGLTNEEIEMVESSFS
jgi:adenine-specific DNA-methyltransferase